jgi:hypothetical protein
MIEVGTLNMSGSTLGNRPNVGRERFVVLPSQAFVSLTQSLRNRARQSFARFLSDGLGKPVSLWIFHIQA